MDRKFRECGLEVWVRHSLVACAVLCVSAARAYDAGTTYTVPAGTTVVVTDADIAEFNTLAGATFGDANAVLEFNTSTPHAIPITGSGTIRKTSTATWAMTTPMPDFEGNYDIVAGVVSVNIAKAFGKENTAYKVYVRNGATLEIASDDGVIPSRQIRLAGQGASGRKGAIEMLVGVSTTQKWYNFYLDDDATMYTKSGGLFFIGTAMNLNGHRLTLTGAGKPTFVSWANVSSNGEVYLSPKEGAPTLYLRSFNHSEDPTWGIPASDDPIVLAGGGCNLYVWSGIKPVQRPLWVSGTNTLEHGTNNTHTDGCPTNHANWAGAVVFTNETGLAKLTIKNSSEAKYKSCMLVVSGPISGKGMVSIKCNAQTNRVALLNAANSYTGGTYIDNSYSSGSCYTLLGYPGTIPNQDFASVTSNYGFVDLALGDSENPRWTYDAAVRFARNGTFNNSCHPRFSNELLDGGIGTLKFRLEEGTQPERSIYLGAKDAVRIEGDGNETPIPFCWHGGKAEITGPDPILFDEVKFNFDNLKMATNSVAVFDGADATLFITNTFYIGALTSGQQTRVVVTNSVIRNSDVTKSDFFTDYDNRDWGGPTRGGAIFVGHHSAGILEVLDGAIISNRIFVCGFGAASASSGGGQGAVFQRGGKVVALGATKTHHTSCVGMCQSQNTSGYYEMDGGLLEARGMFIIGGYGYGCFAQYGGNVIVSNKLSNAAGTKERGFSMATCNQGQGTLYIKKGSWDLFCSDIYFGEGDTKQTTADFTLDGEEASFDAHNTVIYVAQRSSNGRYNFNLNGGVMRCGGIRLLSRTYSANPIQYLTNNILSVNFNGGKFKVGTNDSNLFGYNTSDAGLWATNVAVYAGGATIDTDGQTGSKLDMPVRGAWGKGVKSIALAEPIKGTDKISSPRVVITGDGIGASAFAYFDSTNMVVDRIIVTSPGCGYTSATGMIYYGRDVYKTLTSDAGEIVLEDNANTGSFTKTGEGDLTLNATNTWGGATVLKGGTLKAGCDWAVPTNSAVVLGGGGVLDLNGKAARISSLEYTAGGGSIVNASAAELPASFSLRTTLEDVLADRAIVLQGDQDLSGVTLTVEGDDYSALDKNVPSHRVLTVTGGRLVAAPNVVAAPPPTPWAYTVRPDGIILHYVRGGIFIMR